MSFETTRQMIAEHLGTLPSFGFPIEWEGGKTVARKEGPWGRWSILQGTTEPAIIGPGHTRGTGVLYLQVFIPKEQGTKAAMNAADNLARIDRRQLRRGNTIVTFDTTGIINAGEAEGFVQKNVACNFTRDTYS